MGDDIVISSIVIKSDTKDINFIKVIIGLTNGSMDMKIATYEITEELKEHIENKHRVCLPCKVIDGIATMYVPFFWDDESIENYTQALLDELYLNKKGMNGHKSIEQIEESFKLEIILL
jgi:hypothetical protein